MKKLAIFSATLCLGTVAWCGAASVHHLANENYAISLIIFFLMFLDAFIFVKIIEKELIKS